MAGKIFISYRREETAHVAGRLHDSLALTFGRNKLFVDVVNNPVGRDFEDYLKSQVAACDAMLAIIGPNWLTAKDETGQRRLDNHEDFVAIEIGAALTRDIPVVPVLVDGARMPKAGELPDSLKPLARRQAVQVRHTNFSSDVEALVKRLREVLGYDSPGRRWRVRATKALAAMVVLLLLGLAGYEFIFLPRTVQERQAAADAAVRAEREQQARAVEAEAKRKANKAELLWRGTLKAAEDSDDQFALGEAALRRGDPDKAITNFSEAIRLDPTSPGTFWARGLAYEEKGDYGRAIKDYDEAIRLDPNYFFAFCYRGKAKLKINDASGNEDIAKARQIDPSSTCR